MPEKTEQTIQEEAQESQKHRLALWFSVHGDIRFLSQRDSMEMWRRALRRSQLPLRYSQGFNPHLRLTLPLPRSVGLVAEKELLVVELCERPPLGQIVEELGCQLPAGIALLGGCYVPRNVSLQPAWAQYEMKLADQADHGGVAERITEFVNADHWPVHRPSRGRHPERTIDLKEAISHLQNKDSMLSFTVAICPEATPRIDEIRTMLQIEGPDQVSTVKRVATGYDEQLGS